MSESVPGLLTPVEYQLLAAPALQAAAEVAAQRGDPHLYNDMASMLALLGTVTALTHAYLQQPLPADSSPHEVLEIAPLSVCALVFTESGLDAAEVEQCLRALSQAYLKLLKKGVLGPQEGLVEKGFAAADVALVKRRLDSTHWKRHLPTTAMLSSTSINDYYLRPVDY